MLTAMRLLARLKFLRGTALDVFGRSEERRAERAWIERYETALDELTRNLTADNHAAYERLLSVPDEIRGYGHVKEQSMQEADALWRDLSAELVTAKDRAAA